MPIGREREKTMNKTLLPIFNFVEEDTPPPPPVTITLNPDGTTTISHYQPQDAIIIVYHETAE